MELPFDTSEESQEYVCSPGSCHEEEGEEEGEEEEEDEEQLILREGNFL